MRPMIWRVQIKRNNWGSRGDETPKGGLVNGFYKEVFYRLNIYRLYKYLSLTNLISFLPLSTTYFDNQSQILWSCVKSSALTGFASDSDLAASIVERS